MVKKIIFSLKILNTTYIQGHSNVIMPHEAAQVPHGHASVSHAFRVVWVGGLMWCG